MARRVLLVHLAKRPIGQLVVVLHDIARRKIVERLFGPALRRELVDEPPDDAHVLRLIAELADRERVEEERFTLPRRVLDVRIQPVARVARALEIEVALGDPHLHELAIVALRRRPDVDERAARLRVALRAEQPLGAPELELVAIRSGRDRRDRQALELARGNRREVAQREFVDDAREGLGGFVGMPGGLGRAREAHQHFVGRGRFRLREAVVDVHRGRLIARGLVAFRFPQRGGLGEIPGRRFRRQRLEGAARIGRPTEAQLCEPLVVLGVGAQGRLLHRRLLEHRQRLGEVAVDLELHGRGELIHRAGAHAGGERGVRREPQLRRLNRQARMVRPFQRRVGDVLGARRRRQQRRRNQNQGPKVFHVRDSRSLAEGGSHYSPTSSTYRAICGDRSRRVRWKARPWPTPLYISGKWKPNARRGPALTLRGR